MLFLFRSAPEVEKRIHSKLFRKFWRSRGTKEPAYITVYIFDLCVAHLRVQKQEERAGAGNVVLRRHHPRDPQQGDTLEIRLEKGEASL